MKAIIKLMQRLLPHILFILSGIFIVFLILDDYNPTMDFATNAISMKLLWAFCILSFLNSALLILAKGKERGLKENGLDKAKVE
jgi:hypothetical protein